MVGIDLLAVGQFDATDASALDAQVAHAGAEADLAAQRFDLGAHLLDHAHQPEGADVRLADIDDLRRRAGLDEFGEHLAAAIGRILDLAVELAVRKGACACPACNYCARLAAYALACNARRAGARI